ncbi:MULTISPECIES: GNAT family N-acyltransferase [Robiginitalea]|uniref:Putative hemolysin n=1 Tax=Robiginitalea biformata (strain ATCC BAA-864 / DSM 15991 / KCTC 12146 / HTCC2501) TaxID=313596 RepID=A4CH34_ROBBH|nr:MULTISPECIES: lysophospholipid acyltransferase family protein [Robiginitalea]EAR16242.1 Putative hemolysin [Robiginitalea biformata HTCC2501]MDC6353483.1 lysophospholipid acyltransferase family protein [Robiginitalea sp. PM2]MDC6373352.1 lysophospholipid acyltransferase family protein [Robiginitalea sp. SP8]
MSLVTAKEVSRAINLDRYGFLGTLMGWVLMQITRISSINRFYKRHRHLEGTEFLERILEHYEIDFEIPEEDIKRLPKEGAFITISNHPLGGIDGVLLLKLLLQHRQDYKIIANFLLQRIEPLAPFIMPVNPFENHRDAKSSVAGFKRSMEHLGGGHPLGIFPAGEVSTYKEGQHFVDKPWEEAALKLIRRAEVPVVPIYFHARNSRLFYYLSRINDIFRTAKLPSELTTQRNRSIKVRIGHPISVAVQKEHDTLEEFSDLLRRKTYLLANAYERERLIDQIPGSLKIPKPPRRIADAVRSEVIQGEIEKLREKNCRLLQNRNYEVFLAQKKDMPFILQEIGRQREVTFRAIGEGTNKSIDLDRFDDYYHHLFLWDDQEKKIVGAYRMGMGSEIFEKYGIDGFYLQDLFRFEPELFGMMSRSIEMGRAYIVKEYQQKPMPLFLLWKGIVHTTLRHPEHQYLIGGVSISNQFSNFSKSLMIEFMKSHYWDPYVAQYIRPKKEFKVKLNDADKEFVFDETESDLNKFDKLIEEVEPGSLRLPVLIKKYIKQNARVVAFNVDPLFNNSVDGLMYIRIADLPEDTVKPVMEEFQAELERRLAEGAGGEQASGAPAQ